jgi:hypothetical protein
MLVRRLVLSMPRLRTFRSTLVRVLSVQIAALLALWWLQARYHG